MSCPFTPEQLAQIERLVRYDPDSGVVHWIDGTVAGKPTTRGYLRFNFDCRWSYLHQLVWWLTHKEWPTALDHKDRNKLNNQISNLRQATNSLNSLNRGILKNNTSGHTGVYFRKRSGRWEAYGTLNGRRIGLGVYKSVEQAVEARERFLCKAFALPEKAVAQPAVVAVA
jgi:hypothetical protein